MTQSDTPSRFTDTLRRPADFSGDSPWLFIVLPEDVSSTLPRRGRTTIDGTLNGHAFRATLEPDGQLGHWLRLNDDLLLTAGVQAGDEVTFEVSPVEQEPEPELPEALGAALTNAPEAMAVWEETTTIARLDWIHWVTSAKQAKTLAKRVHKACDMLAAGKRRVCCFDPSGHYSNAFSAPTEAE